MPPSAETAEEFIPLSGSPGAPDTIQPSAPKTFQGKTLYPYDVGIEGLMREIVVGVRGDELYALLFLRVLTDLQADFDKYRADGWNGGKAPSMSDEESATAAIANILRAVQDDLPLFQAKANGWRKTLKRKGVEEAIALVNEIVREANAAEMLP